MHTEAENNTWYQAKGTSHTLHVFDVEVQLYELNRHYGSETRNVPLIPIKNFAVRHLSRDSWTIFKEKGSRMQQPHWYCILITNEVWLIKRFTYFENHQEKTALPVMSVCAKMKGRFIQEALNIRQMPLYIVSKMRGTLSLSPHNHNGSKIEIKIVKTQVQVCKVMIIEMKTKYSTL